MRELTAYEVSQVSGGNFFGGVIQLAGAYYAGYAFGESINSFNRDQFNMSLGEAVFYVTE